MKSVGRRILARIARVAWTSIFTALCVAITVLWVRSYFYADGGMCCSLPGQHIACHGGGGRMCVWFEHSPGNQWYDWHSRPLGSHSPQDENRMPVFDLAPFWPKMTRLYIAHWLLAIVTASLAALPWLPRRISLRGLMLVITLLAAALTGIAWIDRTF